MASSGIKPGLSRIEALLREMGHPEKCLKTVHIAGTNGKGSTSFILSAVLSQAGYRVGRFISPHIHSYRERFTINDTFIEEEEFLFYMAQVKKHIKNLSQRPTEFEILTAIALEYFRDKQVDLAIFEVGMGGIYDSTNVIEPVVSVITGIDYDHTQYLGTSLEEIARNKAGIIKKKVPLVMGPVNPPARQVIAARARELDSPLYPSSLAEVTREAQASLEGQLLKLVFSGQVVDKVFLPSPASYQLENLAVAFTALQVLKMAGFLWTEGDMKAALAKLRIPGRMEIVRINPPFILDAAHNPQAASVLASSLNDILPGKKKALVLGVLDDKDAQNILKPLGHNTRVLVLSRPEGSRSKNWKRLKEDWLSLFPGADLYMEEDIIEAIKVGESLLKLGDYLLITGSFYLLDKARKYLTSV
ncbi:bifunctional folylpolyglutamate synthase/dihydrofolate synthase [Syntrophomonas wolfei]|jgi:dihydrofolate synthase/folylpolyglutamate synthase|uniref:tetrahydrofolate synthase n=1 Tax=Syntrophomonas wolfei subsp. wolfei (strain DSM 2245B / Goettingen) TaxID=335541 RepID=Q0AWF7_SYNWW|nr:folylpolyglutamate synthase/dihydrofolate synthase family protein [Syntrophomonas wolfei]ABI68947.1 conserved hypothetical protein [Syntrophomonas wolfei subsp. wolfei str. Goettingen G311]